MLCWLSLLSTANSIGRMNCGQSVWSVGGQSGQRATILAADKTGLLLDRPMLETEAALGKRRRRNRREREDG